MCISIALLRLKWGSYALGWFMNTWHVYASRMSPALNRVSVLLGFEPDKVFKICNGILFNFYPRLPHMLICVLYSTWIFDLAFSSSTGKIRTIKCSHIKTDLVALTIMCLHPFPCQLKPCMVIGILRKYWLHATRKFVLAWKSIALCSILWSWDGQATYNPNY